MRRDEFRYRPALTRAESERIRRTREALVDGGLLTAPPGSTGVPPEIETSWRRCVGESVPVAPDRLDYREPDDEPALRRAAEPVFARLRDSFAGVPVAMVLSDATGRIILRHTDVRRQRDTMDRAGAAEGFDFSEHSAGTNGLGTVLVERRPVLVRGPEHYNTRLEGLTCAGTPVVEPYTGRMVGSFSLACAMRDVHPLMTVMTGDVGRQIESRMLDEAGDRRRRLVRAYLDVDRTASGALVVDEDTVLANRVGLAHTGPELHPVLWRFLSEHGPAVAAWRMEVPLADGLHDAMVEPIHDSGRTAFSIRLAPRRAERAPSPVRGPVPGVPARDPLHHDPDVDRRLDAVIRFAETVAVTGASGTGKRHTAVRVLRRRGAGDPLVVQPHLDPDWFAAARAAAALGRGIVVCRVDRAPSPTTAQLQALVAAPLALTADLDDADDAVLGTVRQVATTVRLPTIAQSREHLPALVTAVLGDLPAPRFSTAVWERLTDWHWPGNVAELRTTVVALARRADGGTVDVDDLPDELRTPRRAMGRIQAAERDAVAEALREADGNRSRAARSLGIGRNTLYRKMREFGIE